MIDLHTHLLPGVDDGSPTHENSVRVLERMRAEGVTDVACTPHLEASRAAEAPFGAHARLLAELRAQAPPGIRLHKGFEVMLDVANADLTDKRLALGDSKAVLVEFPREPLGPHSTDDLMQLRASGVVPVIAHPERYQGITIERLHIWRDMGVVIQGDGLLLLASGKRGDFARQALSMGLLDILASDNHGDTRALSTIRLWLHEVGGDRHASILLDRNPRHVLDDEMLEGVPALHEHKTIWDRLRELFTLGRGG
jgi:protein-tyrosine phosphatase